MLLHKPHIWEKSGSRDMDQNAPGQSDYRIFKSSRYLEQMDGIDFLCANTNSWKFKVDSKSFE